MATGNMPFPDPEKKGPYYIFEKIRNVEIDYPQVYQKRMMKFDYAI